MPALQSSLQKFADEKSKNLKDDDLFRALKSSFRDDGVVVERDGKELISFCCNDYLGLSKDKRVIEAGLDALKKYGAGAGASRLVTGNYPLYDELEELIAEIKGVESSCVFGSGYLTNLGVIPVIAEKGDLILYDKLSHSCIYNGIKLSDADSKRFLHNDLNSLNNLLKNNRKKYNKCLIVTETIFSMDGDQAPLLELQEIAKKYDAWLMSDDAHGFAILKDAQKADIQMGTLSKAVGCYGGYVCGQKEVIDYIKSSAKSLIYSTALPPAVIASAIAACKIIRDEKDLSKEALKKARLFTNLLGVDEAQSAIVPIILGEAKKALDAEQELYQKGFLVSAIRPPTVPAGTSRLRFTFSRLHKDEDIKKLAEFVKYKGWHVC